MRESLYQLGGSLPADTPVYAKRKADDRLYQTLKAGEFCYVLNSRQMGKSSLRVRTMRQLQEDGIACADVDITEIGSGDVTLTMWYAGIIKILARGFSLTEFNMRSWWQEQSHLSPVQRLGEFVESVLLASVEGNLVIFIDEIDSVLGLDFSLDDFFAWIRACYNKRVDNPEYNRLTFCFLGVATPGDLIQDKRRTPFNIGKAIELNGFQLHEAQPLVLGLKGQVDNPQEILQEILSWTGGQPFLTQKVCQLIIDNCLDLKNPPSVKEVARKKIIENWEAQDEPEHLKTIRDRILRNEQRASRLLGLYQQVLDKGSVDYDGSEEQTELRLSGLVVKRDGCLKVSNRIYQAVFNKAWLEKAFAKLRPYSEAFAAWVDSGCKDESRLLRGEALQEAQQWASGKSLSDLDYKFLAAGQNLEKKAIQLEKLETEATLEIEKQKKEAAEQAYQVVEEANKQAKRTIRRGGLVLGLFSVVAMIVAVVTGIEATKNFKLSEEAKAGARLEQQGINIERQIKDHYYYGTSGKGVDILYEAMETGQELFNIVKDGRLLTEYPALIPLYALQQSLSKFRERATLKGHQDGVSSVAFSPDGQKLVTASRDGTARIWDLQGNEIAVLPGHQDEVSSVAFSPDGQKLVTASGDGTARIWDLRGNEIALLQGHQDGVNSVAFSPDGQKLVTASGDRTTRIWDLRGNEIALLQGHQDWVSSVAFSPNGQKLVTASGVGTARIWDLRGNEIAVLQGHQDGVSSVAFSSDGQELVTASRDGTARIWDLRGNEIAVLQGHQGWVSSVAFSPDGQELVTASRDGTTRIWDLLGSEIAVFPGHQGWVNSVAFSPDGQKLATASRDGTAKIWDLRGNEIAVFPGHQDGVSSIAFSPDGQKLVTASGDGTARIWDLRGSEIAVFPGHQGWVSSVAFSFDGQKLATASGDGTARIWDLLGNEIAVLPGHQDWVSSVVFSPDGQKLATASRDGTARIWDLLGNEIAVLPGHQGWVSSVAFSPDGQKLATASGDGTARIWDLRGNKIAVLQGYQNWVSSVAFSPDGQKLATASEDGTARIWDLRGNKIAVLQGHQDWVNSVAFSPDGQKLATASRDGTARIWAVEELGDMLARGCKILEDYFVEHPESLDNLSSCQDSDGKMAAASGFVKQGEKLAQEGDVEGAVAKFQKALELNSDLELDPETKAKQLAAPAKVRQEVPLESLK